MFTTTFEKAKFMLYSGGYLLAPRRYLDLTDQLTPSQRNFLLQESEVLAAASDRFKEGRRRLGNGRLRQPGGGRKELGAQPEYRIALEQAVELQSLASPLEYGTQSVRGIADAMKQQGWSCSPHSVPGLAANIGLRVHPPIKPSSRIKSVNPADQFEFIGRRLEHVLSKDTAAALYITVDPLPKTPCNCPTDRLEAWRGQALAEHVRTFLDERRGNWVMNKIDELMLVVEGGGLLGLRNRNFPHALQSFANLNGITVYLSHLPSGISRVSVDSLLKCELPLEREQWKLGAVRLQIGSVNALFPPANPKDGNFRPTSWNRIFRPINSNTDPLNDQQATPSGDCL